MLYSGHSSTTHDKSPFEPKIYYLSPGKGLQIPYHPRITEKTLQPSVFVINELSSLSTFATYKTVHTSNLFEVDVPSLSKISRRFVFSALKRQKAEGKTEVPFRCHLKKKLRKRMRKDDVYLDLPLLIALKSRKDLSLQELYGSFSEMLGAGSGGMVRSTYSITTGKKHAIKTYRSIRGSESRRRYYENISNEIYIGASLDHPNIIKTVDVTMEGGQIHQVMEFCTMDMVTHFKCEQVDQDQINQYFVQMMKALRYLHQRGVAHRDVKLENFCLGEDGYIKLIDFGCAFIFNDPLNHNSQKLATSVTGTDPYIAPEIHKGEAYDAAKADVWSAAVVLICMILRKFPWEIALTTNKAYANYLAHRCDDSFYKHIPSEVTPLLRLMLNPNPVHRPNVEEIFEDCWFQSLLD
ncbi:serine/threonine protein kinase [Basidiobolus ranarum]|uniref:Serine/threonine protein kinase n=1 Tax=Basidiobolus ranarum TaxID=34480 RepID=A0ABR2WK49_9FUNG